MKGYLFISEKEENNLNYERKIQESFSRFFGKENVKVKKNPGSSNNLSLYNYTNEPNEINYSHYEHHFGLSGDFLKDEDTVIHDFLSASDKEKYISEIGGIFTISWLHDNTFTTWSDITRIEPIYYCETPKRIVVGTKALLVHLIAYGLETPNYDVSSFVSFLNNGFFCDDNTPFMGVKALYRNSKMIIYDNHINISPIDDFDNYIYTQDPTNQFYDEISELFLDSFSYFKKHNSTFKLGLTGGKDSRLVIAAMHKLGVNVETITNGFEDTPDVIIGKKIANQLNIKHEVKIPPGSASSINIDLYDRAVNTIKNCEGMLFAYENISGLTPEFNNQRISIGGQGGGLYKGGYAKLANITSREELLEFFLSSFAKYNDLINDDEYKKYTQFFNDFIDRHPKHLTYSDILNSFYLTYRSGRWSASSRSGYTMGFYSYPPLFESRLAKKAQLLKTHYGSNEHLIYNILLRINSDLVNIPFAEDRWSFEKGHPYSKYDIENWIKRKPLYATSIRGGFNWRKNILTNLNKEFYEVIFADENSPIFDIVNKNKVKELFNKKGKRSLAVYDTFLWSLFTSSIMLSDKWYSSEKKILKTNIKVPKSSVKEKKGVLKKINLIPNEYLRTSNEKLQIEKKSNISSTISWKDYVPSDRLYFQLFDNPFSQPPSEKYANLYKIEGSVAELFFEVEKHLPDDFLLELYFIQYNNSERVESKKEELNILNQKNIYKYKAVMHPEANRFKVAFKISEGRANGTFDINQMRIHFYS
ncbi:hypothetical protein [Oceanobacillus aidingensis]|uniref:Asparagine synthase (Glutamine-hydrolysing) n=1 Tax=Oceanobacillus aidingensis TaxID=645964 RepID=A0ABV9JUM3_9BACI